MLIKDWDIIYTFNGLNFISGCGHCKKMKPEWQDAAQTLKSDNVSFFCFFFNLIAHIYSVIDLTKYTPSVHT